MYKALLVCILIAIGSRGYSQEKQIETTPLEINFKTQNKGKFYFYWGWNKAQYSYSDIRLQHGNILHFWHKVTLHQNVKTQPDHDRQT